MTFDRRDNEPYLKLNDQLYQRTLSGSMATNHALFHSIVIEAMKMFADVPGWEERTGAYWAIAGIYTEESYAAGYAGNNGYSAGEQFRLRCKEKLARLASHRHHLSSAESRNPDRLQFGGAIRTNWYMLSMSGLPEDGDEICVLKFAVERSWLTDDQAKQIAEISDNWLWKEFSELLF
ncbi:MAG: hypothetical protein IT410_02815 [Candidatus Doudnabacteria bacterium]|nr:hypothetical protein [Candidatus Doudnabacteria bacterium]